MATIEVKSLLKKRGKGGLLKVCENSLTHKRLQRSVPGIGMGGGWRPEHIVTYIVAFKGPTNIRTVAGWLPQICKDLGTSPQLLPEMIVVLGKGVVWRIDAFPAMELEDDTTGCTWAYVQQKDENIFTLFVHMLTWMGWATPPPHVSGYCASLSHRDVGFCKCTAHV